MKKIKICALFTALALLSSSSAFANEDIRPCTDTELETNKTIKDIKKTGEFGEIHAGVDKDGKSICEISPDQGLIYGSRFKGWSM